MDEQHEGPAHLIKRSQHPGGDDRPETDLRKQRERGQKEETVDQKLDGVRIRQLRRPAHVNTHKNKTAQNDV